MGVHEGDLVRLIESGEGEAVSLKGPDRVLRVDLKEERVTVRLSREEMGAVDRECKALGVGRSTVIRMLLRQALGLTSREAAALGATAGGGGGDPAATPRYPTPCKHP